jgi:hypothetical protein
MRPAGREVRGRITREGDYAELGRQQLSIGHLDRGQLLDRLQVLPGLDLDSDPSAFGVLRRLIDERQDRVGQWSGMSGSDRLLSQREADQEMPGAWRHVQNGALLLLQSKRPAPLRAGVVPGLLQGREVGLDMGYQTPPSRMPTESPCRATIQTSTTGC